MIREKFTDFIEVIRKTDNDGIGSFAYKLEKINFRCILETLNREKKDYLYFERKNDRIKILAWNPLESFIHSGINRIALTEESVLKLQDKFRSNWNNFPNIPFPLFMGGIKFHPDNTVADDMVWKDFHDSEWFIPSYLLYENSNACYLVYNFKLAEINTDSILEKFLSTVEFCDSFNKQAENRFQISSNSILNREEDYLKWEQNVKKALKIIEEEDAEKIVLSRRVKSELSDSPVISLLLNQLADQYPGCHVFAYRKNESIFFGASPERLASISGGWIEADALAGSCPRGSTNQEDLELEKELITSQKNLNEQKAVVDFIAHSFEKFTDEINYPENPIIRKLPNIQHLWTPIKAKLCKNSSVFSLLKEIHPTPAICGVPWNKALSFINDSEPHNRGLYAGIIGWFNFDNEGEFIVALRSGLIQDKTLYAFAGCGIVKGSDPKLEYEESELKLQPILSQFKNGRKS